MGKRAHLNVLKIHGQPLEKLDPRGSELLSESIRVRLARPVPLPSCFVSVNRIKCGHWGL